MNKNKYIIKPGSMVIYEGHTYRVMGGLVRDEYKRIYLDAFSSGALKPVVVELDTIVRIPKKILDIRLWGHSIHLRMIEGQVRVSWDRETMTRRFDVIDAFGKPMFSVLDPYDPNRNVWVDG